VVAQPGSLDIALAERSAPEAKAVIEQAKSWNLQHGFVATTSRPQNRRMTKTIPGGQKAVSGPLRNFLTAHFPKPEKTKAAATAGNFGVIYFALSQPPPSGRRQFCAQAQRHRIHRLRQERQGFPLMEGEHFRLQLHQLEPAGDGRHPA
jgi:hypothetical protein